MNDPAPQIPIPEVQATAASSATKQQKIHPLLKLALELGPLAIFFVSNQIWGIFPATAILMVAVAIALVISYVLEGRLPIMPLVYGSMVLVFGGLTLILHDELFIKIKPTIVNSLYALTLLIGLLFGRSLIKVVMEHAVQLPDFAWRTLTWRYAALFAFLAVLNEVIWRNFSTDFWVAFKVWGVFPTTLVFTMLHLPYIAKHQINTDTDAAN